MVESQKSVNICKFMVFLAVFHSFPTNFCGFYRRMPFINFHGCKFWIFQLYSCKNYKKFSSYSC
jgi:hypothetical protein